MKESVNVRRCVTPAVKENGMNEHSSPQCFLQNERTYMLNIKREISSGGT